MIALLRGRIAAATLGEVVLDVAGVGYRVLVPPGTVRGAVGDELTLWTHLSVREDALTLFGFAKTTDRELFQALLSVSGVGPKLALAALGTLGAQGLSRAITAEDIAALVVVPGVGRKGAQRIVLELRGKLAPADDADTGPVAAGDAAGARGEVRQALSALGYAPAEVRRAMDTLPDDPDASPETLLGQALKQIAKRG